MQDQWSHEQGIACHRRDGFGFTDPVHVRTRDRPAAMTSRNDAQRAIFGRTVVQMKPHGHHPGQNFGRRLHMRDPALDGPVLPARQFTTLFDSDRQILMPRDGPVCALRFVKENSTYRAIMRTYQWAQEGHQRGAGCDPLYRVQFQDIPRAEGFAIALGTRDGRFGKSLFQFFNLGWRRKISQQRKTLLLQGLHKGSHQTLRYTHTRAGGMLVRIKAARVT